MHRILNKVGEDRNTKKKLTVGVEPKEKEAVESVTKGKKNRGSDRDRRPVPKNGGLKPYFTPAKETQG